MHRTRTTDVEPPTNPAETPCSDDDLAAIVAEEEALLAALLAARARTEARLRTQRRDGDLRSVDSFRALRDEARASSDDDLPSVLLEMSVRRQLLDRADPAPLPDAACPYLAHLRVFEDGKRKDYLLGATTLVDLAAGIRLVDFRTAAIAGVFYRHREGEDYELELPGRTASGVVEARRILTIDRGVLVRIVAGGRVFVREPGGTFRRAGGASSTFVEGGAGTAVRSFALGVGAGAHDSVRPASITAELDPEQWAAITTPPGDPLLVLGTAGSGKTTVALHRLAHLAASAPDRFPRERTRVIVPEEGLARLVRRLLGPLGFEREGGVTTLDRFAEETFRSVFRIPMPKLDRDPPGLVTALKRHPAFYRALVARLAREHQGALSFAALRGELVDALSDRAFLSEVVQASRGGLSAACVAATIDHTVLQLADPIAIELAAVVVPERKQALDGRPIDEGTPEQLAGSVDLEDLPILLAMRAMRAPLEVAPIAHLVLDEAEDVSAFELHVLRASLDANACVTLAGDEAQRTFSSFESWDTTLGLLGVERPVVRRLAISYRCPRPIAELARAVLGAALEGVAPDATPGATVDAPVLAAREGAPVGFFRFDSGFEAELFVAEALADLVAREPRASIAVVAADPEAARRYARALTELPEARLVEDGGFTFEPGIDVTHVDDVKGLEFDYVVIPDATAASYPDAPAARHRLHVAMTRASHQLWLVAAGRPSPCLPKESWDAGSARTQ